MASRLVLALTLFLAGPAQAAKIGVGSPLIVFTADTVGHWGYLETWPDLRDLLYSSSSLGSSHVVFKVNDLVYDMQDSAFTVVSPVAAVGTGEGAYIQSVKQSGALRFGQRFTVHRNPRTNSQVDTIQYRLWVTNLSSTVTFTAGARLELDLQLIDNSNDDAFISFDNGLSSITVNTLHRANGGGVPFDYWGYDRDPLVQAPTLASRGVTRNNSFGLDATPPDALEAVHWTEVAGQGFWDPHPNMGQALNTFDTQDTCIVLWWTGTGQEGASALQPALPLFPGQTLEFITYYGLNEGPFLVTPTPYNTFSPTRTPSPSPSRTRSFTVSPTRTDSATISPTHSISPTFSVSPTITASFSISPTFSTSPTATPTPTLTRSFSFSPTPSDSPTVTATPTATVCFTSSPTFTITESFTFSPTATPTFTVTESHTFSPTFSFSPTASVTRTRSPSPTASPSLTPSPVPLLLSPRPPNPNPSGGDGVWLPYILSKDAEVFIRVYTIAGEVVRDLPPFNGLMGANEEFWNHKNDAGVKVASGVFIYSITAVAGDEKQDAWMKLAVLR